ncbi:MAG: hypothetical protein KAR17_11715, partial [Cyclobacteriaceae bacterium]|nr:hypothetical protein [Cyclobacteriaceae bacterium]
QFNTKNNTLYNLNGTLVFPHVKKVGGEVAVKGKVSLSGQGVFTIWNTKFHELYSSLKEH